MPASSTARAVYESFRAESTAWQAAEHHMGTIAPQCLLLLEDLFHAFHEPEAPLNPDVHPAFHWNFAVVATLAASPDAARLRGETAGDPIAAALVALRLAREVTSEAFLTREMSRRLHRAWRYRHRRPLLPLFSLPIPDSPAADDPALLFSLSHALHRTRECLDVDSALRSTWGIHPGARSVHQFDDVCRLLDMARSIDGFQALTEMLERFRSLLQRRGTKGRAHAYGKAKLVGYTLGRDVDHVAPEEVVKLTDRSLEALFYEAYEHRRLLQHAYTGPDRQHRGPLVCCMDVSRSMNASAALGHERFLWAKAIGVTVMELAQRAQRPFLGICFSSEHELASFSSRGTGRDPDVALAMVQCDFNGGTRFEAPLNEALTFVEKQEEREGHLVLITDGEAPLSSAFQAQIRRRKSELGLRVLTVFIDGNHAALGTLSDHVFHVSSERTESWERALLSVAGSVEGRP